MLDYPQKNGMCLMLLFVDEFSNALILLIIDYRAQQFTKIDLTTLRIWNRLVDFGLYMELILLLWFLREIVNQTILCSYKFLLGRTK